MIPTHFTIPPQKKPGCNTAATQTNRNHNENTFSTCHVGPRLVLGFYITGSPLALVLVAILANVNETSDKSWRVMDNEIFFSTRQKLRKSHFVMQA